MRVRLDERVDRAPADASHAHRSSDEVRPLLSVPNLVCREGPPVLWCLKSTDLVDQDTLEPFSFPGGTRMHFREPGGNVLAGYVPKEPRP